MTSSDSFSEKTSKASSHNRSPLNHINRKPTQDKVSSRHPLTKGIVVTLWNLTKKYEIALKHDEVIPIKESEIDREEVADAYRFLETPWERVLDGRCYQTLATMQHRRDAFYAVPNITPEEWISQLALEVKRRATPLLYLTSREVAIPSLSLPKEDTPISTDEKPSIVDRKALAKYRIPYLELLFDTLDSRREQLIKRLQGKRFTFKELSEQLTNWELDLLSQMIRDGNLPATFTKRTSISFQPSRKKTKESLSFATAAIEVTRREKVRKK